MNAAHVDHPLHGPGRVVAFQRGGRLALVEFQSLRLPTLVPVRELSGPTLNTAVGSTDVLKDHGLPQIPAPALTGSYDQTLAIQTLEAMRLGVVPANDLEIYTVGRERELAIVDADLQRVQTEGGAARAFLADYGVGKTHLLERVGQRALAAGYLTANVVLDAREAAPSHPKRVYRALVRALRYPERPFEEGSGLRPLLERAALSADAREAFQVDESGGITDARLLLEHGMHLYLTPAIAYMSALAKDDLVLRESRKTRIAEPEAFAEHARDLVLDWLEGHPTVSNADINDELAALHGRFSRIYSLSDYRPWARIYSYILSGIAALARRCGYQGLVVLIDEAELYNLLSSENREYAKILFKALSCASLGPNQVPFDADDLNLGGAGILQELPARYSEQPGLYTVFAMTPNADGIETLFEAIPRALTSELSSLSTADYDALVQKVGDFYASARPDWQLDHAAIGRITTVIRQARHSGHIANPRQAMKLIIELLDLQRYYPDRIESVIRSLQHTMF
ncbi:MAG: DUF2791 family P-loop domain-containing protein [Bradymonadaceae bacterium]|nr:DUF2791 family P-loop domain-containing protein [Lujinxingiaceae bacterium]